MATVLVRFPGGLEVTSPEASNRTGEADSSEDMADMKTINSNVEPRVIGDEHGKKYWCKQSTK